MIYLKDKEGNRYEFDDRDVIGQGGMGIVYFGRRIDVNGAKIKVAIKEIKAKTKEIIERAQRESQIQLNHDNLVRMYAFVESEIENDGFVYKNYYVISEYLEGVLLDDIIKGKLASGNGAVFPAIQQLYDNYIQNREETATEVIKSVLSGVMALHDEGYLHRDIDPTNIMLTSDGRVKLIDFGIAKHLTDVSKVERKLTTPGAFVGKPEYSAPELIRGDIEHQGYYTDVYAIGILYFQMITGHIPFEGSRYDIIKQHLNSKIPLKEIRSKQIRKIIKRATEKDFNKRYATASLFRAEVDNIHDTKSYKQQWLLLLLGLLVVVAAVLAYSFRENLIPETRQSDALIIQNLDSIEYEKALVLLGYNQSDSIEVGIEKMIELGQKGNYDAVFELVKTYAWIPNDNESNRRKQLLNIELDPQTKQPLSGEINRKALNWLDKAIQLSDSCDYQCLYWQSFYYLNGLFVNVDMNLATQLLNKSREQAVKAGDTVFLDKIKMTLQQIKQE